MTLDLCRFLVILLALVFSSKAMAQDSASEQQPSVAGQEGIVVRFQTLPANTRVLYVGQVGTTFFYQSHCCDNNDPHSGIIALDSFEPLQSCTETPSFPDTPLHVNHVLSKLTSAETYPILKPSWNSDNVNASGFDGSKNYFHTAVQLQSVQGGNPVDKWFTVLKVQFLKAKGQPTIPVLAMMRSHDFVMVTPEGGGPAVRTVPEESADEYIPEGLWDHYFGVEGKKRFEPIVLYLGNETPQVCLILVR